MALIDLILPMDQGVESCPGEPRGYFMPFATLEEHGWSSHQLLLYTHGGTVRSLVNHPRRARTVAILNDHFGEFLMAKVGKSQALRHFC